MKMKTIYALISIVCIWVGFWYAHRNDIPSEVGWLFAALVWRLNMGVSCNETRS